MADYEISELSALSSPAPGDLLAAVDISDTETAPAGPGGSNKSLPLSGLLAWIAGVVSSFSECITFFGGTDTSETAAASTPSLVSGTAAQVSTVQDVMLYCNVKTASTFSLAIGPTSAPATTVAASGTAGVGLVAVRVPRGWYVKSTFTSADVTWTAVTC